MNSLGQRVLLLIQEHPGLSDREITDRLLGEGAPQQGVNQACRVLRARGDIARRLRQDGKIGNFPTDRGEADAGPVRTASKPSLGASRRTM